MSLNISNAGLLTELEKLVSIHRYISNKINRNYEDVYIVDVRESVFSDYFVVDYENISKNQDVETITIFKSDLKFSDFFVINSQNSIKFAANKVVSNIDHLPQVLLSVHSTEITPYGFYENWLKTVIYLQNLSVFELRKYLFPQVFYNLSQEYTSFNHPIDFNKCSDKQDEYLKVLCIFKIIAKEEILFFKKLLELDGKIVRIDSVLSVYSDFYDTWKPFDREYFDILALKFYKEVSLLNSCL
jgi:hypothetical protein